MQLMIWMCERGKLIFGIVWNGANPTLRLMFSGRGAVGLLALVYLLNVGDHGSHLRSNALTLFVSE